MPTVDARTVSRRWMKGFRAALYLSVLSLCLTAFSYAQQRQVVIRDGSVFIDGRKVPQDQLPPSLSVEGLDVLYSFRGIEKPLFFVNGHTYQLSETRLVDVNAPEEEPQTGQVSVIFRDGTQLPEPPYRSPTEKPRPAEALDTRGQDLETISQVRHYIDALHQQAEALYRISARADLPRAEDLAAFTNEMRLHAQKASRLASDLPKMEVQSYLQDVQQQDVELYGQLVREWELEAKTYALASTIRDMDPGPERDHMTQKLRTQLERIFELKQENRRREIEQLEKRLTDLQNGLEKRERMRDRMIDKRLGELLNQ